MTVTVTAVAADATRATPLDAAAIGAKTVRSAGDDTATTPKRRAAAANAARNGDVATVTTATTSPHAPPNNPTSGRYTAAVADRPTRSNGDSRAMSGANIAL